jgi:AraC-like DNA-binding protein
MTAGIGNVTLGLSNRPAAGNTVAAGMAKGLLEFAVGQGADRSALLSASGLTAADLSSEDARLPFSRYVALYWAGEVMSGDPALALHFGESMSAMDGMVVCHVGSACETMGAALDVINRFGRLSIDVATASGGDPFQVETSGAGTWLIDASIYPVPSPQLTDTSFTRLIAGTRQLTDRDFVRAVHLTRTAPAHQTEYERIFRAPIAFGERRNALLLDPDWFALPLGATSRYAGSVFEAHANTLLENLDPPGRHGRAVEEIVRSRLASSAVSMQAVARQLGISRQTLYRRLQCERTTFEAILTRVRQETAQQLLREGVSVGETAHRLGFSDHSAFSRAYKRWTGRSPARSP